MSQSWGCAIEARSITSEQREQLHDHMIESYHTWHALARLLSYKLDRKLASIVTETKNMHDAVFAVVEAAEESGWLHGLIEAMVQDQSGNDDLHRWAKTVLSTGTGSQSALPQSTYTTEVSQDTAFSLSELRRIAEKALETGESLTRGLKCASPEVLFESVEINADSAAFMGIANDGQRRVFLRLALAEFSDPAQEEKFLENSELAREISDHPHVAKIVRAMCTARGNPYMLQLLDQEIVYYVLPLPPERVVNIGAKLADALWYAHSRGVTFGVIKPSSILITTAGEPVLTLSCLPTVSHSHEELGNEDVNALCAALLSMLPSREARVRKQTARISSLEDRLHDCLRAGIRDGRHPPLAAPELRDQLNALRRDAMRSLDWNSLDCARLSVCNDPSSPAVLVTVGDLFSQDADIVVGFSDTFDTAIDTSTLISKESLQGQLISRVYNDNVHALDCDLDDALRMVPAESLESRNYKSAGKLKRYPVGTIATLERDGRRIYAIAYSKMERNLTVSSCYEFLEESLRKLWAEIRGHGFERTIAMPIIGSGLSRTGLSREALIRQIVTSFWEQAREAPICRELRIIVHPADLTPDDILGVLL
jgi:serine/threonine protein kinase